MTIRLENNQGNNSFTISSNNIKYGIAIIKQVSNLYDNDFKCSKMKSKKITEGEIFFYTHESYD